MKILFWNIRGWGQEDRRRQIAEFIKQEHYDIVGIQETIKESLTEKELNHIAGSFPFMWTWLAAKGHSGCILLGIKQEVVDVGAFEEGEHYVSALLRHKKDGFKWEVIVVYGPAQHDKSEVFLEELSAKCNKTTVPLVIGGDFNLIRGRADKNIDNIDWNLVNLFNDFIAQNQLQELKRSGSSFTWTNKQDQPVLVNLDRILITPEWG